MHPQASSGKYRLKKEQLQRHITASLSSVSLAFSPGILCLQLSLLVAAVPCCFQTWCLTHVCIQSHQRFAATCVV